LNLALKLDPVSILALVACASTVGWSVCLLRRFQSRRVRLLIAILALAGFLEGVKVVQAKIGVLPAGIIGLEQLLELIVTLVCLVAILLLGLLGQEHNRNIFQLRLSEADMKGSRSPLKAHTAASREELPRGA
jgi:hypothetical protein